MVSHFPYFSYLIIYFPYNYACFEALTFLTVTNAIPTILTRATIDIATTGISPVFTKSITISSPVTYTSCGVVSISYSSGASSSV